MTIVDLLERDDHLRLLGRAWDGALAGSGSIVLLAGESGIGKTELARAFADGLGDGPPVLWGVCDPLGVPRPFGPLHDVVADLGDDVGHLLSGGAPQHEIFRGILDVLTARSVLLVVDDLQWADEATVDLLRHLLRRITGTRSLVLATYRDDDLDPAHPVRALLGDVARSRAAARLDLAPLSLAAVTAMIGRRDLDPARLHRLTRGNSFFVTEIVRQDGDTLPATVRDAVLARAVDLDPAARDLADLLACAPGAIPDALLPALGVGLASLRALNAVGLIAHDRRGIAYRHDICRLAIAGDIPPGGALALHRRILEAFETRPDPDPAVLTHHALEAGDDERVFRYGARAGRAAAGSGAHTEAARFFRSALDHAPESAVGDRAELAGLLSMELYLTDRLDEATAAAHRAVAWRRALGDVRGVSVGRQSLAVFEYFNGNRGNAVEHAAAAVEVLEADAAAGDRDVPDRGALGHAYSVRALLAMHENDLTTALAHHDRARHVARGIDDHTLDVRLAVVEALGAMWSGDGTGRDRILAALAPAGEDVFEEVYSVGLSQLANVDVEQRRLDDAEKVLDRSIPLTVQWDVPLCHSWQRGVRGRLRMMRGAWDEARYDACAVLADSAAGLTHTWPNLVSGLVDLRCGRPDADERIDRGWDLAVRYGEPLRLLPAAAALAERSWLTERPDPRLDDAATLLADAGSRPGAEWSAGDLAVWLTRAGRPVDPRGLTLAMPYRMLLDGDARAAGEYWRQLGSPYDQALAMIDAGEPAEVFAALEALDRLGADAVAARVRRELRRDGVTGIPTRPRAATRANPAGLTARQVDVLALVAEGLTNAQIAARLFITEKTADHHVSAILTKLDVRTRREAATRARTLGIAQDRRRAVV